MVSRPPFGVTETATSCPCLWSLEQLALQYPVSGSYSTHTSERGEWKD